ncbi:hypothetical protein K493DRAFT_308696 [Basidiobolus meristosporus CBS 931.73]|uniref:Uncharacterized protein n=1 Tax=Basidiobolus meristosporus CBS 931.73 TaxID=1314790 RepID=A0A1Y1WY75_9FUNG|nr:hypothetical protein K493DRAFT_308696 [Basidiobolus meristosporus CBS 931.73]|eukprot:ORX78501.1 hypothetical protein K493DRAFT_308696 [Basidiobolus meristosporus CBS 931.73]
MILLTIITDLDFSKPERCNLYVLNNIKWDIKLLFRDGFYYNNSNIFNITNLKDYVKTLLLINELNNKYTDNFIQNLKINSDQQLKEKLDTLEYDLIRAKQESKRVLQKYEEDLKYRLKLKMDERRSRQRLDRIQRELKGLVWNFNKNMEQKPEQKILQQFGNLRCKLDRLKEILEKKSKRFEIRYIKHLSNDELKEFENIFLDDETLDEVKIGCN